MEDTVVLTQEEAEAISAAFNTSVLSFSAILALILCALWYLLQAVALYSLAKKNNIKNAWRAFIPVVQISILGDLIDNRVWGFGHAGLLLALGQLILLLGYFFHLNIWIMAILAIVYFVYLESAMSQFYKDYEPYKGILFFMLGLFFPFTIPIWLFVMRKKVKGMAEYPIDH